MWVHANIHASSQSLGAETYSPTVAHHTDTYPKEAMGSVRLREARSGRGGSITSRRPFEGFFSDAHMVSTRIGGHATGSPAEGRGHSRTRVVIAPSDSTARTQPGLQRTPSMLQYREIPLLGVSKWKSTIGREGKIVYRCLGCNEVEPSSGHSKTHDSTEQAPTDA